MSLLAHRVDGVGSPVLLLNGGMMSIGTWGPIAEALAKGHRVMRCDLRGQLLSPGDPPPTVAGHVPDVLRLLVSLKTFPAHVVGTSLGAEVALYLAARHPEAVASLVVLGAVDRFPDETLAGAAEQARACREALAGGDRGRVHDLLAASAFSAGWAAANRAALAERRAAVAALPDEWFAGLAGLLESLPSVELGPHLAEIRCPALVVAGEEDGIMPLARVRAVADGIRGARFACLPGCGHAMVVERPDAVVSLCREFLDNPVRPGAA